MSEAEDSVGLPDLLQALPELMLSLIGNNRTVRLWCKAARQAVDKQRRFLIVRDAWDLGPGPRRGHRSCESLLQSSRGFLDRGCRPDTVELRLRLGSLEERRHCGASLLQAFADQQCGQHSDGFRGPSSLVLHSVVLLSPTLASGIAAAFPALEGLQLDDANGAWADSPDCLEGLNLLLGSTAGQRGAGPLMPQLARLRLPYMESPELGGACVSAAAAQCGGESPLRELEITLDLGQPDVAESLASLTQLQALKLTVWRGSEQAQLQLLPSVLAPLVGLTELSLSGYDLELPGAVLMRMTGLRQLEACGLSLGMGGLEALRSLTSLMVERLLPPPGGAWGELLAAPAALWPLPPRLRSLWLRCGKQPIELLAALQRTSGITFTCGIPDDSEAFRSVFQDPDNPMRPTLDVIRGRHTTPSGILLAAGEAALCGAIRLLTAASVKSIDVTFAAQMSGGDHGHGVLLRPVAGADGPGGPHHSALLTALGSTRLRRLSLKGIRLSTQDLDTIARCAPSLEDLGLPHPTDYPLRALARLVAGLPNLHRLVLAPDPLVAAPRDALSVLFKLLRDPHFEEIVVDSGDGEEFHRADAAPLAASLERMLSHAGVDPYRIQWYCLPFGEGTDSTTESYASSDDDG